jgi:hypothetical protein
MNYLKGMFGEHRFTKASISVELHHSTIDMVGSGSVE